MSSLCLCVRADLCSQAAVRAHSAEGQQGLLEGWGQLPEAPQPKGGKEKKKTVTKVHTTLFAIIQDIDFVTLSTLQRGWDSNRELSKRQASLFPQGGSNAHDGCCIVWLVVFHHLVVKCCNYTVAERCGCSLPSGIMYSVIFSDLHSFYSGVQKSDCTLELHFAKEWNLKPIHVKTRAHFLLHIYILPCKKHMQILKRHLDNIHVFEHVNFHILFAWVTTHLLGLSNWTAGLLFSSLWDCDVFCVEAGSGAVSGSETPRMSRYLPLSVGGWGQDQVKGGLTSANAQKHCNHFFPRPKSGYCIFQLTTYHRKRVSGGGGAGVRCILGVQVQCGRRWGGDSPLQGLNLTVRK